MMFVKLRSVRDKLAAVRAVLTSVNVSAVDSDTARSLLGNIAALDAAVEDLDDAMVAWVRTENYARNLPPITDHTVDLLRLFAGTATTGELVA